MLPQPDIPSTDNPRPSLIESPWDKSIGTDNINSNNDNDPSDDDDNGDDDDDVDCSIRQDTQPVSSKKQWSPLSSPAYTQNPTQAPRKPTTNRTRTKQTAYRRTKPTHTVVPKAPLLVWDGTQYQLDYSHNHRPISTWDGTTHTDIVYDDDDDYNGTNDYAYGDPFNMNDSSNQLQFTQCLKTVQF